MEAILIIGGIVIYFIPSFIGNDRRNFVGIFLINFFFGWTFLGWVASLIWALADDKKTSHAPPVYHSPRQYESSSVDEIVKLNMLREKGALSEAEYQKEKERILNR